jgi:transposase
VGPDVHKKTIAVATVEARASADVRFYGTIPDTPDAIRSMLRKLAKGGQRLHLGNFSRFASPRQLMASLGLNPSEHSSDATIRRGAITKTGNSLARTCLVEAAWTYRHPARVTQIIRERLQGCRSRSGRSPGRRLSHTAAAGTEAKIDLRAGAAREA